MVSDFVNPTIFWEYDVDQLNADEWAPFIIKQVFNRNVVALPNAIPALIDYYGQMRVVALLKDEEWLTQEGIQTAMSYFPELKKSDFKATFRINRRKRQLARAGSFNPTL